jgi:hypothetical protein
MKIETHFSVVLTVQIVHVVQKSSSEIEAVKNRNLSGGFAQFSR